MVRATVIVAFRRAAAFRVGRRRHEPPDSMTDSDADADDTMPCAGRRPPEVSARRPRNGFPQCRVMRSARAEPRSSSLRLEEPRRSWRYAACRSRQAAFLAFTHTGLRSPQYRPSKRFAIKRLDSDSDARREQLDADLRAR
jgi:hypothetical protein